MTDAEGAIEPNSNSVSSMDEILESRWEKLNRREVEEESKLQKAEEFFFRQECKEEEEIFRVEEEALGAQCYDMDCDS